jgi:hypothetical protein
VGGASQFLHGQVEIDEDVFIDSKGILPNEDHTLEEARAQTMKMIRFQYVPRACASVAVTHSLFNRFVLNRI